jgi:hypothetical protein
MQRKKGLPLGRAKKCVNPEAKVRQQSKLLLIQ